jgi:pimeloyl-ACP methyl ester carboxylesterase
MPNLSRRELVFGAAAGALWARESASARPVNDGKFVRIGGLQQWIAIRERSSGNPAFLFLHGGPGEAMSPFLDLFDPYEADFTAAIWDQRGAGKTFGRAGRTTPGMNLEQFIQDTIEIAGYVRRRLSKERIVLIGQSWGASLGLQVAKRRPDLFYAFVGTGQPVKLELSILSQERFARVVYTAKHDRAGLEALEKFSKLPVTDPDRQFATRKLLMGAQDQKFVARETAFTGSQPPTKGNVADWIDGYLFTSDILVPKIMNKDPIDIVGFEIPLPFIVIQGSEDHITPTDVARDYFEKVHAPFKAFVKIDGHGHFAFYTNPESSLAALKQHVLPLCRS